MEHTEYLKRISSVRVLGNMLTEQINIKSKYKGKLSLEADSGLDIAIYTLRNKYYYEMKQLVEVMGDITFNTQKGYICE